MTESDLNDVRKSANSINKKIAIKRNPSQKEIKDLQESIKELGALSNLLKPSAQRIATMIYQPFEKLQFQNIQALQQAIQAAALPQINIHPSILNESDGDAPAE